MKREANWPRYMKSKRLTDGAVAYYWAPHERDRASGFTLGPEPLGKDYAAAVIRAGLLNQHLDDWRDGKDVPQDSHGDRRVGTIDWWCHQFFASDPFRALAPRTQQDYREALAAIADLPTVITDAATGEPMRTGALPVSSLSQAAVDKIYKRLRRDGAVTRQANYSVDVARRAWKVVRRQHPGLFLVPVTGPDAKVQRLAINPFEGVERANYERDTAIPATRAQVFAFVEAASAVGHPALGVAALICFEWHQRPEDVRMGRITWTDYRPEGRPTKEWHDGARRCSADRTGDHDVVDARNASSCPHLCETNRAAGASPAAKRRDFVRRARIADGYWLGRQDSNLGMAESKSAALPLGYAPSAPRSLGGAAPILGRHFPGNPARAGHACRPRPRRL